MEKRIITDISQARIVYMGTPEISAIVLRGMIEAGFPVVGLVCNEDKITGRGKKLEMPPTKKVALEHGIPVFQPHRIRLDYAFLEELKPDVIVTMAYGQIVPKGVLDIPGHGCINLHGSLLPKLRGAAPIQRSLINGDSQTGVTLMEMVEAMDAGKMFDKAIVPISEDDYYSSLAEKIGVAARELILSDLLPYLQGKLPGIPQEESVVTIAPKILPVEEHLSITLGTAAFLRYVRGLSDVPGGYLMLGDKKLKIYSAHFVSSEKVGTPGEIVEDRKRLHVQLQDGIVSLDSVQLEGKKRMDSRSFVNGNQGLKGRVLE